MAYSKQTWDTTSAFNPTRMNHIEDGIADSFNQFKTYAELGSYDYTTSGFNERSIQNISNYRFLLMGIKSGSSILNPLLIPVEYFKTKNSGSNYVGIRTNLNANTFVEIAVFYISNTSIGLYLSGSNVGFVVYGII